MAKQSAYILPFEPFIDSLKLAGFQVDTRTYEEVRVLLDRCAHEMEPQNLINLIRPLIVKNQGEIEEFNRRYKEFFTLHSTHPLASDRADEDFERQDIVVDREIVTPEQKTGTIAKKYQKYIRYIGYFWAIFFLFGGLYFLILDGKRPDMVEGLSLLRFSRSYGNLFLGIALLLLLFRKKIVLFFRSFFRKKEPKTPPYIYLPPIPTPVDSLFPRNEILHLANPFRRKGFLSFNTSRIDVAQTISKTIENGGRIEVSYPKRGRIPQYVILIDQTYRRNFETPWFEHIVELLIENGIEASYYLYQGIPDYVWGKDRVTIELDTLVSDRRLLLFGQAESLINYIDGGLYTWAEKLFEKWESVGILTPKPSSKWGYYEEVLAQFAYVAPANFEGISAIINAFDGIKVIEWWEWMGESRHEYLLDPKPSVLSEKLPKTLFQWICCCAIYPQIEWKLALRLGQALESYGIKSQVLSPFNLSLLTQVGWFREGRIPDDKRKELLKYLPYELETYMRRVLKQIMDEASETPPSNSYAAHNLKVFEYTNRLAITEDPLEEHELLKEIAKLNKESVPRQDDVLKENVKSALESKRSFRRILELWQLKLIGFWRGIFEQTKPKSEGIFDQSGKYPEKSPEVILEEKDELLDTEVKVLLLGNGGVGKSCLIQRLVHNRFETHWHSTHAISLEQYPNTWSEGSGDNLVDPYVLNLWDFSGQDIYHATHRLFMQSNAVYLLLWDHKTENTQATYRFEQGEERWHRNHSLHYWLSYARSLGKDSPVIVVQTKIGQDGKQSGYTAEIQIDFYNQFSHLDFHYIESAEDNWNQNGYTELLDKIREAIKKIKSTVSIPTNWVKIRQRIRELQRAKEKSLELMEFYQLAEAVEEPTDVLQWLSQSGVVFYKEGLFNDEIILDQAWAIEPIYTLFDREGFYYEALSARKGEFSGKDLAKIWNKNSEAEQELFVSFMLSCELCFETTPKDKERYHTPFLERTFIAPQLLPPKGDSVKMFLELTWKDNESLYFRFEHEFLHYGVIQSLLVRLKDLAKNDAIWKTGVLLEEKGQVVQVEAYNQRVDIRGSQNAFPLLQKIRRELQELQVKAAREYFSVDGQCYVSKRELEEQVSMGNSRVKGYWGDKMELGDSVDVEHFSPFLNPQGGMEGKMEEEPGPKLDPMSRRRVFFSYASGKEKGEEGQEKVVDDLFLALTKELPEAIILRDKMDLQFGGLVSEFLDKSSEQDLIIIFFSDAYIRSAFCMYEIYEIARVCKMDKDEFSRRVLTIPLEDLDLEDPDVLDGFYSHWEEERENWELFVKERMEKNSLKPAHQQRYEITKKIKQEFGEFINWLPDIHTSDVKLLSQNDYLMVKTAILARLEQAASFNKKKDSSPKLLPTNKRRVYFSYDSGKSRKQEAREKVVDDLFLTLTKELPESIVLRDKANIEYGGIISEFLANTHQQDLIIIFISSSYLKSAFCMIELYEIARDCKMDKDEFSRRVLTIPLEDLDLEDPDVLDGFYSHWEEESEKWERFVAKRMEKNNLKPAHQQRYQITKKIEQEFGEFIDWLADIHTSDVKLLSQNDYLMVKTAILVRLGKERNG